MNRSVWFPADLADKVRAEASRQDRSFNWVVVKALEKVLGETGPASPSVAAGTSAPSRTPAPPAVVDVIRGGEVVGQAEADTTPAGFLKPETVRNFKEFGVVPASSFIKRNVKPIPKGKS